MKKRDALLTILLVGVFFISFASAGWFSDTWNLITGNVVASDCTDSDGGLNYYIKGTVSYISSTGSPVSISDWCSGSSVIEETCMNGRDFGNTYRCPNGCVDGACINSTSLVTTPTCTSFTYSEWSACVNGQQTRTVLSSLPSGCTGGTQVLSQACVIKKQNNEECVSNSDCSSGYCNSCWSVCSDKGNGAACCSNSECLSNYCDLENDWTCKYLSCTSFTYSEWSACVNGQQTRTVLSSLPSGCTGGTQVLSQACTINVPINNGSLGSSCSVPRDCLSGICDVDGEKVCKKEVGFCMMPAIAPEGWCSGGTVVPQPKDKNGCSVSAKCVYDNSSVKLNDTKKIITSSVSSCKDLYEQRGFLFAQIGEYSLMGVNNVPLDYVESGFFKNNGSGYSRFYYALGKVVSPDAVLSIEYYYVNSSAKFSEYNSLEVLLNKTIWDLKNYKNGSYYSFYPNSNTSLKSYEIYTKDNFLVAVSLNSNKTDLNKGVANVAIQRYLDVCSSDINAICFPKWSESIEPLVCPASGIQKEIWTDVNNCGAKIEKQINCTIGDCAGCSADGKCYPISYRIGNTYCDFEGLVNQKTESAKCSNNFECSTNLCVNGTCISSSIWEKFLSWFRALFGVNLVKSFGGFL